MYKITGILSALGLALILPQIVSADENNAFIRQISPEGTLTGNSLTIDQSAATGSMIRGVDNQLVPSLAVSGLNLLGNDPGFATQRGEGNTATLTLEGAGGELQLFQSSGVPGVLAQGGNRAVAQAEGGALGTVIQIGQDNLAALDLGTGATGLVSQLGSSLSASLDVGADGSGQVVQIGNNSDAGEVVVGAGASVTYIQIGNNLSPATQSGVQVMSTPNVGNITITQTGW